MITRPRFFQGCEPGEQGKKGKRGQAKAKKKRGQVKKKAKAKKKAKVTKKRVTLIGRYLISLITHLTIHISPDVPRQI